MVVLDVFSRTFVPLATQAGIPTRTLRRHMRLFRRYADPNDATMLVGRCVRPGRRRSPSYLMLLTRQQLIVTRESILLHRPRVYLRGPVSELEGVRWSADPGEAVVDLALSTPRGRERFWIRALYTDQMWRLDAALGRVFRNSAAASRFAAFLSPAGVA